MNKFLAVIYYEDQSSSLGSYSIIEDWDDVEGLREDMKSLEDESYCNTFLIFSDPMVISEFEEAKHNDAEFMKKYNSGSTRQVNEWWMKYHTAVTTSFSPDMDESEELEFENFFSCLKPKVSDEMTFTFSSPKQSQQKE